MAEKNYTGVSWKEEHKRWQSVVRHDGINYSCGMHLNQMDAVKARDRKIIEKGLPTKRQILKPVKK